MHKGRPSTCWRFSASASSLSFLAAAISAAAFAACRSASSSAATLPISCKRAWQDQTMHGTMAPGMAAVSSTTL